MGHAGLLQGIHGDVLREELIARTESFQIDQALHVRGESFPWIL